ncbi:hypothetical protein PUMCH_004392 [Australozyma saopauloensis]|uniref:SSD domain-containing protein n=1 Tax=Australozyma saopauloensis TaxID=291208 RepID=A0AAX4HFB1_9ASCO|nr:hypothetical protein PUMCH_004392 [[Candida] saopauloensis]
MKRINSWLIASTAQFLKKPKLFILLPILFTLFVAYDALYDLTLRPINSHLLFHYNNFTLSDGTNLLDSSVSFGAPCEIPPHHKVMKVTLSGSNALRFDFLQQVYEYEKLLPKEVVYISPLSMLPLPFSQQNLLEADYEKVDKYILRILNHDYSHSLVKFFYNDITKLNHLIKLAEKLYIYVIYDPVEFGVKSIIPHDDKITDIKYLTDSNIGSEFSKYFNFIIGQRPYLQFTLRLIKAIQLVAIFAFVCYVFLCISNSHRIRSNMGLVIGWGISVLISSLASVDVMNFFKSKLYWPDVVGATNWISSGYFLLLVMLFSSRNLIRTINDLAGDSTFGAPENIHKRLIKFFLGINNSVNNSQGVYYAGRLLRKYLFLDQFAALVIPIPNTTVILLINLTGTTFCFAALVALSRVVLKEGVGELYYHGALDSYLTFVTALLIDHFLQLSFIVGIIIIDLNRLDLTDLINQSNLSLEKELSFHEVNNISAFFFGRGSCKAAKGSLRHRLGTFFLKVRAASLSTFWLIVLPGAFVWIFLSIAVIAKLIIPSDLSADLLEQLNFTSTQLIGQTNNFLYYSELLAVVVFIIACSELTFVLTYSKRQRRQQDYSTTVIPSSADMTVNELLMNGKKKMFESITLRDHSESDILKLNTNTKCPLLVSTDLEHNVFVWLPSKTASAQIPLKISTFFGSHDKDAKEEEFWPINHIEVSDNGFFIVLINYNRCRLKCYDRRAGKFVWEVSLTSELELHKKRMSAVATFYRKKTVAGFLARKLLLKQHKSTMRRGSNASMFSSQISGNYPPPHLDSSSDDQSSISSVKLSDKEKDLHRDEFCMILESGELITISCDTVKIKVYNILSLLYEQDSSIKIISLKLLKTARVNDRVVCNLSNDEIVVGTAVNNVWRFNKLDMNVNFNAQPQAAYAPPMMKRSGTANRDKASFMSEKLERQKQQVGPRRFSSISSASLNKFPPINKSHIVVIDFVGMFVRVQNLHAELIDVMTGTILKVFHIGSFKPGSFRVSHSEPSHCKFCGCASFESLSLIYEDFYDKTLIVHSYTIENKKSRSNICLRVERDPREVRCVGFDSVIEQIFWYEDVEKWELTDMNVIMGIKKVTEPVCENVDKKSTLEFNKDNSPQGLSSLRSRKKNKAIHAKDKTSKSTAIKDLWQGFVITVLNGKLLNYSIPNNTEDEDYDYSCTRPNYIMKYGYKAIAIAFGSAIKILYLGGDHLIENDLYYSGTTSSLNQILKPSIEGPAKSNSLLFISKRRNMMEQKRTVKSSLGETTNQTTEEHRQNN